MEGFLSQAVVYLAAAVIACPLHREWVWDPFWDIWQRGS